ncbi:MAG: diacylglycerol kinase family protein [Deltaproteobacteria bacterium]|nr:diacylglycerol kinase family protein [Deltaproteobacteria bacterium]
MHTVIHQRNMKIHLTAAAMVSLVGSGMPLGLAEKVTLIFCVLLVFFAEILNSALEQLVDLATEELHPNAGLAKDAAAAGVLVLSIGTMVIFTAIIFHNFESILTVGSGIFRQAILGVPLTVLMLILVYGGRRPVWVDALIFTSTLVLWVAITINTYSTVFSAMTLGLIFICASASWRRRQQTMA